MEKDDLFKLYQLVIEQEKYFFSEHQKRIAFYGGLLTTLIAGTVTGIFYADSWYHFLPLIAGPILIIYICRLARLGTTRLYQRFLETITMLAKVEEDLGLTQERDKTPEDTNISWVMSEPFVTKRHMNSRVKSEYRTSQEWVNGHLKEKDNYHGITMTLFDTTQILGWLLFAFTAFVGLTKLVLIFAYLFFK